MALSFVFGGSGAGKSSLLFQQIIEKSIQYPEQKFYIVVPDQFTMQTQKELVTRHPRGGIMNIDVLSFSRLAVRILEETGGEDIPVLDDTGKNLILRLVAQQEADKLQVLKGKLNAPGYIHEVKSAISEFMQYRITPALLGEKLSAIENRGALVSKLSDLQVMYEGFLRYLQGKYITPEEKMVILAGKIPGAELSNCSIYFDGFTGFTPVQMEVIRTLMIHAKDVCVSLVMRRDEDIEAAYEEQNLFALTRTAYEKLCKIAEEEAVERGEDVRYTEYPVPRLKNAPALAFLENHLFSYPIKAYAKGGDLSSISVHALKDTREEALFVARKIRALVREGGYRYQDIAVVCGNMDSVDMPLRSAFEKLEIPYFQDRNRGILMNPFIELIRSALTLFTDSFSVTAMNHYMRSLVFNLPREQADRMDNYLKETGIRGVSKWKHMFTAVPKRYKRNGQTSEAGVEFLAKINESRAFLMDGLEPLFQMGKTAAERVEALYAYIVSQNMESNLLAFAEKFAKQGDRVKEQEYRQIYRYIIDLLGQIHDLLGDEKLTMQEFKEILDAGFAELQVGMIPQNIDHVLVGDIERTRLKNIKILFFLGVNDTNIPRAAASGGIISDVDRSFLRSMDWELAPTPKEKMYSQRLYLYMNMTRPTEALYISYVLTTNDGNVARPAYLIDTLKKLYPELTIDLHLQDAPEELENQEDCLEFLANRIRMLNAGILQGEEEKFAAVYQKMAQDERFSDTTRMLHEAAMTRYQHIPLKREIVEALYGKLIKGSVSRLETFAKCAYSYFLKYGIGLWPNEEFGFEKMDMGNVFHETLEKFSNGLQAKQLTWENFSKEECEAILEEVLNEVCTPMGHGILYETNRGRFMLSRIRRIMMTTISQLQGQLQNSDFKPIGYEVSIKDTMNISGSDAKMELISKIDRLDVLENEDEVYVKVMDYKSSAHDTDLKEIYAGVQLQLVSYMNAACKQIEKKSRGKMSIPAGMMYYKIDDPIVQTADGKQVEKLKNEDLVCKGFYNGDMLNTDAGIGILDAMDYPQAGSHTFLGVTKKKDGTYGSEKVLSTGDLLLLGEYVGLKEKELGEEILKGNIAVSPFGKNTKSPCEYCDFSGICGINAKIPGYESREGTKDKKEILAAMQEELDKRIEEWD